LSARYGTSIAIYRADWKNQHLQEIEHDCRDRPLVSQLVARCNSPVDDCTCDFNNVNAVSDARAFSAATLAMSAATGRIVPSSFDQTSAAPAVAATGTRCLLFLGACTGLKQSERWECVLESPSHLCGMFAAGQIGRGLIAPGCDLEKLHALKRHQYINIIF
jgi:hypothetical protein